MTTAKFIPGMIYLVKDQFEGKIGLQTTQHNYIVIGTIMNAQNSDFHMVQAMQITSNPGGGRGNNGNAVPIVLSNGAISWILPYNIHSITFNDIENGKFHGIINDNKYFSTKGFIQMLVDLYNDELGLGFVDHNIVMNEYHDYCDWFFKEYANLKEYKDLNFKDKIKSVKRISKPQKYYKKNDMNEEQIIPMDIDPETEKDGPDYETVYSSDSVAVGSRIPVEKILITTIKKKYKSISDMNDNERRVIKNFIHFPRFVRDWSDDQINTFINAYKMYGAKNISKLTSDKWSHGSAVYYTYQSIQKMMSNC